jgi:predicted amidohydrolase
METLPQKAPRIALIQLHVPEDGIPVSQFKRAEKFIRQAATQDADLAILPEMALGYCAPENLLGHAAACSVELVNFQSLAKVCTISFSR